MPHPEEAQMTPEDARACLDVLREQEQELRYEGAFGSSEAFALGRVLVELANDFEETYVVTIQRASDGETVFQWVPDDKGERNLSIARAKIAASRASGHAAPWASLEAIATGSPLEAVWATAPREIAGCGGFPIYAGGTLAGVVGVSGVHNGGDHEVIVRALEHVLGKRVSRFPVAVK